jgi:hypothetical protein
MLAKVVALASDTKALRPAAPAEGRLATVTGVRLRIVPAPLTEKPGDLNADPLIVVAEMSMPFATEPPVVRMRLPLDLIGHWLPKEVAASNRRPSLCPPAPPWS